MALIFTHHHLECQAAAAAEFVPALHLQLKLIVDKGRLTADSRESLDRSKALRYSK